MTTSNFPRYDNEILAWEYDQRQPSPFPGELEWHLKYAARSQTPLLEYTCGSGRLTIPIARAGYRVDGVDRSETMLNRLREKLAACDAQIRQRVRLFRADMSTFGPDRTYDLIAVPFNSLQYLETQESIATFFHRVRGFLTDSGHFIFVIRRPEPGNYLEDERVVYDWLEKPVVNSVTGISVGSRMTARYDPTGRQTVNHRTHVITTPDGGKRTIEMTSRAPVLEIREYMRFLNDAGFDVRVFSGYGERPDDGESREVCFVCTLRR